MLWMRTRFRTGYHRQLADKAWLRRLTGFVEERLGVQVLERARGLRCAVRGAYEHERHMGPHSAVKNHFVVEARWWSGWTPWKRRSRESCRLTVRYVPATGEFRLQEAELDTRESREAEARKEQAVSRMMKRILARCSLEEVESFVCPTCGAPMSVDFSWESLGTEFTLACSAPEEHVRWHEVTEHPPGWWMDRSSDVEFPD